MYPSENNPEPQAIAGQSLSHLVFGRSARGSSVLLGLEFESIVSSLASAVVLLSRLNIFGVVVAQVPKMSVAIDVYEEEGKGREGSKFVDAQEV